MWLSFHLYYHGDLDRALLEFVQPLVTRLRAAGRLESFFFVRYFVGGPHVRLRLAVEPSRAAAVERDVQTDAARFLARWPSLAARGADEIRRQNRAILAHDPGESEDAVFPDNTLLAHPFLPETERYGGPELLPSSLDFFALSSISALQFLAACGGLPRGRRLVQALRLLTRQFWSFAAGAEQALAMVDAFVASRGLEPIAAFGDRAYEQRETVYRALLWEELRATAAAESGAAWESIYGRALAAAIAGAPQATRLRIGTSQIHMTANRIGITNPEEAYLGRVLARALRDMAASEPARWHETVAALAGAHTGAHPGLSDLVAPAFDRLLLTAAVGGGAPWPDSSRSPAGGTAKDGHALA